MQGALAPTMSAPPFPGKSGRAASKREMGNSTPYSQPKPERHSLQCRVPTLLGLRCPTAISPSRCRVMLFEVSFRPDRRNRLPGRARPCTIDTSDMGTPALELMRGCNVPRGNPRLTSGGPHKRVASLDGVILVIGVLILYRTQSIGRPPPASNGYNSLSRHSARLASADAADRGGGGDARR